MSKNAKIHKKTLFDWKCIHLYNSIIFMTSLIPLNNEGELIKGTTNVIKLSGEGADKGNKDFAAIIKKMDKDRVVNTVNGNAEHPGYVSYNVDGLEYLNESKIRRAHV